MSITGSIVLFVMMWWIIFFAILPLDVNRNRQEKILGADPGAPENPKIGKKIFMTSIITSFIFIVIYLMVKYEYLNIRNILT